MIQHNRISIKLLSTNNWSARYVILRTEVERDLAKFINKFKSKTINLHTAFNIGRTSSNRCLVIHEVASGYNVKIKGEFNNKINGFAITPKAENLEISLEFLAWYLDQQTVRNSIILNSYGSIITRINREFLLKLPIPKAKRKLLGHNKINNIVSYSDISPYRSLLKRYLDEFYESIKIENLLSSIAIAGAISELILFQLLSEQETMQDRYLKDRGLGSYIDFCRILDLEKKLGFRLQPFDEIKTVRNKIIHPSNLIRLDLTDERIVNKVLIVKSIQEIVIDFGI